MHFGIFLNNIVFVNSTNKQLLFEEEGRLADLDKQQRDMEWETEGLRNKIAQLNDKLYGGKVKNPKELLGFEQEAEILKASLRQKEDHLLDLMADIEEKQDKVKSDTKRLKQLEKEWQKTQEELGQKRAEIEDELSHLNQERQALTSGIEPKSLELYEVLRSRKGLAIVRVEQGRCQGCRLNLPVSEWQRVRTGALVQCSSCGRILCLG